MIHYSVLIPQRNASQTVASQLPALCQALDRLILPYEILCIDDASSASHAEKLRSLMDHSPRLRVLAFDVRRGAAAALTAGIAATRGELIVATTPDLAVAAHWLPHLIARLAHADFVYAQRQSRWPAQLRRSILQAARHLTARGDVARDELLLWAGRREALANVTLARGAFRYLPTLLAERGFRVLRLSLAAHRPPQGTRHCPSFASRLLVSWLARHYEPHLASEWASASPHLSVAPPNRVDAGRARTLPHPTAAHSDQNENRPHTA